MPSLEDDIDAVVKSVGVHNVGVVWALGNYNWSSAEERDAFLSAVRLSGVDPSA